MAKHKIAVFIKSYYPYQELKSSGQIVMGLNEIGIPTKLVTIKNSQLNDYKPPFNTIAVSNARLLNTGFWKNLHEDTIIAYFDIGDQKIYKAIKKSKKKLVLKMDHDGKIIYPAYNYTQQKFWNKGILVGILRIIKWYIPCFRQYFSYKFLRIIQTTDCVIIESNQAKSNILSTLKFWGEEIESKKIFVCANPVTPDIIQMKVDRKSKKNIVIAIGRWEDYQSKNTFVMIGALKKFLAEHKEWKAILIGSGKNLLSKIIKNYPEDIRKRIFIVGIIRHEKIKVFLKRSKILFIPSRHESFGLVAAEAALAGCSIVGTPLESLWDLTRKGTTGTLSKNFKLKEIQKALEDDAKKWQKSYYNPYNISSYWKGKLNRKVIAKRIIKILEKL